MCVFACVCMRVCKCVWVCEHVSVCIYVHMHTCARASVFTRVSTRVWCVRVGVCGVREGVCVCVCVDVGGRVLVHVQGVVILGWLCAYVACACACASSTRVCMCNAGVCIGTHVCAQACACASVRVLCKICAVRFGL